MTRQEPTQQERSDRDARRLWRLSGMGLELAAQIVAGLLIGWLIDRWLDTSPTWLVVGTIAGAVVGMVHFIRTALRESRRAAEAAPRMPRRDLSHEDDDDGEAER